MAKRGRKKGDSGNCSVCGKAGHNKRSHKKSSDKPRSKLGLLRIVLLRKGNKVRPLTHRLRGGGGIQRTGKGSGRRGRPRKGGNAPKTVAAWFNSW